MDTGNSDLPRAQLLREAGDGDGDMTSMVVRCPGTYRSAHTCKRREGRDWNGCARGVVRLGLCIWRVMSHLHVEHTVFEARLWP